MAESKSGGFVTSLPGITILFALIANSLWLSPRLRSSRPVEQEQTPAVSKSQKADVRLWEDPFVAFDRLSSEAKTNFETIVDWKQEFKKQFAGDRKVTILPVLVLGNSHADGIEWRQKLRYAVISGLAEEGYAPDDADGLSILPVELGEQVLIPYEKFSPVNQKNKGKVLVLWVPEEKLGEKPLTNLRSLEGVSAGSSNVMWRVIGPFASDTLRKMTLEPAATNNASLSIFSPIATVALTNLNLGNHDSLTNYFAGRQVLFWDLMVHDDELCRRIIKELDVRGVDFREDRIAIFSESDSFYGRSLPETFATELFEVVTNGDTNKAAQFKQPSLFNYLQGLDGRTSGQSAARTTESPASGSESISDIYRDIGFLETPEGSGQLDYISRQAANLKSHGGKDGRFRAIGVLGADVYDKLLLLQSLKSKFPEALFFTTDLNARYFHAPEVPWTRNLIVASGYGLSLTNTWQRRTPPFRDSYQTAAFLATRLAVGSTMDGGGNSRVVPRLTPQCFEICRNGQWELYDPDGKNNATRERDYAALLWQPGRILILILLGFLITLSIDERVCRVAKWLFGFRSKLMPPAPFEKCTPAFFRFLVWSACSFPFVMALSVYWSQMCADGEPFSIIGGISVWPTEFIRLGAIYVLGYLWFKGRAELIEEKLLARNDFFLPSPDYSLESHMKKAGVPAGRKLKGLLKYLWTFMPLTNRYRDQISINKWAERQADQGTPREVSAERIWNEYNFRGYFWHRFLRCFPLGLCYYAIDRLLACWWESGIHVPARGSFSFNMDCMLDSISSLGLIMLTFFTFDATRLCARMIHALAAGPTKWPTKALERYEKLHSLHRDYLDEWMDIQLIARRTQVVSRLIYYPFIVLFLLIVARSTVFDNWVWSARLVLSMTVSSLLAVLAALTLRRGAEHAREESIASLEQKRICAIGGDLKHLDASRKDDIPAQLKSLITQIETCETGAFAPLSKHPVVGALVMPFGGAGVVAILEYLIRS